MKRKHNNGSGFLFGMLVYILAAATVCGFAYLIAVSNLPNWFKWFLLK